MMLSSGLERGLGISYLFTCVRTQRRDVIICANKRVHLSRLKRCLTPKINFLFMLEKESDTRCL